MFCSYVNPRLREVEIDSLTVRHLKVIEEVAGEPNSAES